MTRPARSTDDVVAAADLYHRIWHDSHAVHMPRAEQTRRDEAFFLDRLKRLMPNVIVAEVDGVIVGFAAWERHMLGQLFVEIAHRGSGLADELIKAAECSMRDQGIVEVELHCLVGNTRAKRFYERVGWRVSAIMPEPIGSGAKREERDFWIMRKSLSQGAP